MANRNKRVNIFDEDELYSSPVKMDMIVRPEIDVKSFLNKTIGKDIKANAKNDSQRELITSIKNNEITICKGKPGSGKTYLAVTYALSLLNKKETPYEKIYLVKSVQPLKNEDLGFLKGSMMEKILPYMWSYFINIQKIIGQRNLDSLLDNKIIEPFPLAYMRGASLDNCIIIADEAQNITMTNIKTLMTRVGENSKLIILGDTNQIDLVKPMDSSLKHVVEMFKDIPNIGVVEMNPNDTSIRNPLIDIIEDRFNNFELKQENHKKNKKEQLND